MGFLNYWVQLERPINYRSGQARLGSSEFEQKEHTSAAFVAIVGDWGLFWRTLNQCYSKICKAALTEIAAGLQSIMIVIQQLNLRNTRNSVTSLIWLIDIYYIYLYDMTTTITIEK